MRMITAALGALFLVCSPLASADPAGEAADRLVAAMGGPEAWSKARGLVIRARHWESDLPAPYNNLIQMALDAPRMRFEGDSETMKRRRAVIAVAASMLNSIWHMLTSLTPYRDLGADYVGTRDRQRLARGLVRRLQHLGYAVELPTAA